MSLLSLRILSGRRVALIICSFARMSVSGGLVVCWVAEQAAFSSLYSFLLDYEVGSVLRPAVGQAQYVVYGFELALDLSNVDFQSGHFQYCDESGEVSLLHSYYDIDVRGGSGVSIVAGSSCPGYGVG